MAKGGRRSDSTGAPAGSAAELDELYRCSALANTTAAVFMSALDGSIVIIALPAIFRGIQLDPLTPLRCLRFITWRPALLGPAAPRRHYQRA
jgi:hypothetical protein